MTMNSVDLGDDVIIRNKFRARRDGSKGWSTCFALQEIHVQSPELPGFPRESGMSLEYLAEETPKYNQL